MALRRTAPCIHDSPGFAKSSSSINSPIDPARPAIRRRYAKRSGASRRTPTPRARASPRSPAALGSHRPWSCAPGYPAMSGAPCCGARVAGAADGSRGSTPVGPGCGTCWRAWGLAITPPGRPRSPASGPSLVGLPRPTPGLAPRRPTLVLAAWTGPADPCPRARFSAAAPHSEPR